MDLKSLKVYSIIKYGNIYFFNSLKCFHSQFAVISAQNCRRLTSLFFFCFISQGFNRGYFIIASLSSQRSWGRLGKRISPTDLTVSTLLLIVSEEIPLTYLFSLSVSNSFTFLYTISHCLYINGEYLANCVSLSDEKHQLSIAA